MKALIKSGSPNWHHLSDLPLEKDFQLASEMASVHDYVSQIKNNIEQVRKGLTSPFPDWNLLKSDP